jgi:hypothetical protein
LGFGFGYLLKRVILGVHLFAIEYGYSPRQLMPMMARAPEKITIFGILSITFLTFNSLFMTEWDPG